MAPLLIADSITMTFEGIIVLSNVSLEVGEHELVGLIGPNGAGKTTLFGCLVRQLEAQPRVGSVRRPLNR